MTQKTRQILPREAYFDAQWFEQERRDLFDQAWIFAGVSSALPNTGDYLTLRFMDHPLFVVRDAQGELQAFHNLCRHRGC